MYEKSNFIVGYNNTQVSSTQWAFHGWMECKLEYQIKMGRMCRKNSNFPMGYICAQTWKDIPTLSKRRLIWVSASLEILVENN